MEEATYNSGALALEDVVAWATSLDPPLRLFTLICAAPRATLTLGGRFTKIQGVHLISEKSQPKWGLQALKNSTNIGSPLYSPPPSHSSGCVRGSRGGGGSNNARLACKWRWVLQRKGAGLMPAGSVWLGPLDWPPAGVMGDPPARRRRVGQKVPQSESSSSPRLADLA